MSRFEKALIQQLPVATAVVIWFSLLLRAGGVGIWFLANLLFCTALLSLPLALKQSGRYRAQFILPALAATLSGLIQPIAGASESIPLLRDLGSGVRSLVKASARGVSTDSSALTLGITDGDTSLITASLKQQFKQLSLTHLTAVSGTNCTILVVSSVALLSLLGLSRSQRALAGAVVLAAYVVLVGDQPSVIRAGTMSLVALLWMVYGNKVQPLNLLSFATTIVLIIWPNYAQSLGFQLSVAATLGVLTLGPKLGESLSTFLPTKLAVIVGVAVAAQVCCLPLLIGIQPEISVAAIPANILAEPFVPLITILGIAGAFCAILQLPVMQFLAQALFWLASLPAQAILSTARWLTLVSPTVHLPTGASGLVWSLLILVLSLTFLTTGHRKRLLRLLVASVVFAMLIPGFLNRLPIGNFAPTGWVMVACDVGQGDATVLEAGGEFAVIDVGKDDFKINRCLSKLGVKTINLLVLTHFDLDHVGGLIGAISTRVVKQTLLTQYVDTRPGAAVVERILKSRGIPVRKVAFGDSGILGAEKASSLSWLVLTPHVGGADSVSSNDGSIAMFWHSDQLSIFTMADLPATGQERIMEERAMWWNDQWRARPIILKLSHHGSADQDPDFLRWVHPSITTISVGRENSYGHPTDQALKWLLLWSKVTLRTDQLGSLSITSRRNGVLEWAGSGAS